VSILLLDYCFVLREREKTKNNMLLVNANSLKTISFLASLLGLLLSLSVAHAFVAPSYLSTCTRSSTRLYYRDEKTPPAILTIPVLGPIPNQIPFLPGKELSLNPPTPGQGAALEQALAMQEAESLATIEAAPIVAIMDEYTSKELPGGKKYATIAAIVGVTSNSNKQQIDMTDAASFMESLQQIGSQSFNSESSIRLVGIGRAALHDFFYEVPSCKLAAMDEEGHLILDDMEDYDDDDDDDDDDEELQGMDCLRSAVNDNVIMAQFDLLVDGLGKGPSRNGKPACYSSPVHAIAQMSTFASQIQLLHQDRKRLVAGIKAAEARLRAAMEEDELFDHDGIGAMFAEKKRDAKQVLFDGFIDQFGDESLMNSYFNNKEVASSKDELAKKENYGMGYSAATFSTIRDLTTVWLEKLAPYYSPERQASEEHYYEILSFVAVLAMDKYLEPHQIGWVLTCCNTCERLQQAHSWMVEHVQLLKGESNVMSSKLRDCGEECTDLW
jgi:hypothetical protein